MISVWEKGVTCTSNILACTRTSQACWSQRRRVALYNVWWGRDGMRGGGSGIVCRVQVQGSNAQMCIMDSKWMLKCVLSGKSLVQSETTRWWSPNRQCYQQLYQPSYYGPTTTRHNEPATSLESRTHCQGIHLWVSTTNSQAAQSENNSTLRSLETSKISFIK